MGFMLLQFCICLHNNTYCEQNQSKKNESIYNSKKLFAILEISDLIKRALE